MGSLPEQGAQARIVGIRALGTGKGRPAMGVSRAQKKKCSAAEIGYPRSQPASFGLKMQGGVHRT